MMKTYSHEYLMPLVRFNCFLALITTLNFTPTALAMCAERSPNRHWVCRGRLAYEDGMRPKRLILPTPSSNLNSICHSRAGQRAWAGGGSIPQHVLCSHSCSWLSMATLMSACVSPFLMPYRSRLWLPMYTSDGRAARAHKKVCVYVLPFCVFVDCASCIVPKWGLLV